MKINTSILSKLFLDLSKDLKKNCNYLVRKYDLRYRKLTLKEYKFQINEIISTIENDKQIIAHPNRKKVWQKGWLENLKDYKKNRKKISLIPKYYTARENKFFRLGGEFIYTKNKNFEIYMLDIYRNWFAKKYLSNIDYIYEFGSGSGNNLVSLTDIFPKKNFFGLDFAKSSIDILNNLIGYKNVKGILFDMFKPNFNLKIKKNSAFFTIGSIEQLGGKIDPILNFFIQKKPVLCINIEPDISFYDSNKIEDYLAVRFQTKRGYTSCIYSKLKKKEQEGKIKIIKKFRSPFGSKMIEGYNFFLWKVI